VVYTVALVSKKACLAFGGSKVSLKSLPVEFLFQMDVHAPNPIVVQPGPQGDRVIVAVTGGTFAGPKLKGKVLAGPGAEWATLRPDGSLKADVRLVLETEDEAFILMTYNGIACPGEDGNFRIRTAPLFETGDPQYSWLNQVQAVGMGTSHERGVLYDVYQIL
jgi:hypothetical protein